MKSADDKLASCCLKRAEKSLTEGASLESSISFYNPNM